MPSHRQIKGGAARLKAGRDAAQPHNAQRHITTQHHHNNHHSNTMSSEAVGSKRKARDSAPFDPPRQPHALGSGSGSER